MYSGKESPKFHDPVKLETIKKKTVNAHIRAETEMEKTLKEKKYAKDNSPSPASYRSIECHDKTSKYSSSKMFKYSKMPKSSFVDKEINIKKTVPGVGKYNSAMSIDRAAYRPMRKNR